MPASFSFGHATHQTAYETSLSSRQKLGQRLAGVSKCSRHFKDSHEVERHRACRADAQLPGAALQNIPDLPSLNGCWEFTKVGAVLTALRAGGAIIRAAPEVPFGPGAQTFFSASISDRGRA